MSSRYGEVYGYSGFFPIREDVTSPSHIDALRGLLADLPIGEGSLFSRTRRVHGARFFVIDDAIYNGHPSVEEHLAYAYLAMSITFDGDLPDLAARIADVGAAEFEALFSHCYGYPGAASAEAILGYLKACQIETTFLYVDTDDATLEEMLRALQAHARIASMIERAQGKSTAERRALVRELAAEIARLPPASPGAFLATRDA